MAIVIMAKRNLCYQDKGQNKSGLYPNTVRQGCVNIYLLHVQYIIGTWQRAPVGMHNLTKANIYNSDHTGV